MKSKLTQFNTLLLIYYIMYIYIYMYKCIYINIYIFNTIIL